MVINYGKVCKPYDEQRSQERLTDKDREILSGVLKKRKELFEALSEF